MPIIGWVPTFESFSENSSAPHKLKLSARPIDFILLGPNVHHSSSYPHGEPYNPPSGSSFPNNAAGTWTSYDPQQDTIDNTNYVYMGILGSDRDTEPSRQNSEGIFSPSSETMYGYNPLLSKFMGCFGDGLFGVPQFGKMLDDDDDVPSAGFYPDYLQLTYLSRMIYRGTKYGLINPTPLFSEAVFSHTNFGQPRDMIQPRKYSVFVNSAGDQTLSAVEVDFIDRSVIPDANGFVTNNVTSGSATNSSNISQFCTSSLPYDDSLADYGKINDRSVIMPEILLARKAKAN